MYLLIVCVLLLSAVVFREFYLAELGGYSTERTVLMAVRYSATPLIVAMVLYALQGRMKWKRTGSTGSSTWRFTDEIKGYPGSPEEAPGKEGTGC